MDNLEMIKKMTGESDTELLSLLIELSKEKVLSMTNRTQVIPALNVAIRDFAVIAYNRLGTEGESSRSGEGGISSAFIEIPADIKQVIQQNRLARVNGHAHEKIVEENV